MVNKTRQIPARRLPATIKKQAIPARRLPAKIKKQAPWKVNSSSTQRKWLYKCSFNGLCKFFNTNFEKDEKSKKEDKKKVWFTELQLKKLMDSPFWNVLQIFIHKKIKIKDWARSDDAVDVMVRKYSCAYGKEHAFDFKDSNNNTVVVKSTSEKLAVFFGLKKKKIVYSESDTDDEFEMPSKEANKLLINRLQAVKPERTEKSQLHKADIEELILSIMRVEAEKQTEKDAEDLAMLFTLYLCVTVFFTTSTGSLSRTQFEGYFTSLDKMNSTCWADLIHSHLMQSIRRQIQNPLKHKVSGCVIHLLYLFAEHNTMMVQVEDIEIPSFARWNLAKISSTIGKNEGGAMSKMSPTLTTPYLAEERKLIQEEHQDSNDTDTLNQDPYKSEMLKKHRQEDYVELLSRHTRLVDFIEEQEGHEEDNESKLILESIFNLTSKLASRGKQKEVAPATVIKEQCDLYREEQSGFLNADSQSSPKRTKRLQDLSITDVNTTADKDRILLDGDCDVLGSPESYQRGVKTDSVKNPPKRVKNFFKNFETCSQITEQDINCVNNFIHQGDDGADGQWLRCEDFKKLLNKEGVLGSDHINIMLRLMRESNIGICGDWTTIDTYYEGYMDRKPPNTLKLKDYENGILPLGGAKPWREVSFLYGVVNIVDRCHWVAVSINLKQREIYIYDSMRPRRTSISGGSYAEIDGDWRIEFIEDCPQQPESSTSCGVYALKVVEHLIRDIDYKLIDKSQILRYRREMAVQFYKKQFLEF